MLCLRLGVRMCLFTDRGTAERVCLCVYLWAAEMGGGRKIILKIMLGLVPTRFLFRASAYFQTLSKETACLCSQKQLSL